MVCRFCRPRPEQVLCSGSFARAILDRWGVAVAPRRHVGHPGELEPDEHAELWHLAETAGSRAGIRRSRVIWSPGEVDHFCLRVEPLAVAAEAPLGDRVADAAGLAPTILTTGAARPLLPELRRAIQAAFHVDIAVAFALPSGWERIRMDLEDLVLRGGTARILTGDYLGVTDPRALRSILDLSEAHPGQVRAGLFVVADLGFHPKVYLCSRSGGGVAFVGSSNLTAAALGRPLSGDIRSSIEWNYGLAAAHDPAGIRRVETALDALWSRPEVCPLTEPAVAAYEARRPSLTVRARDQNVSDIGPEPPPPAPIPHEIQREALDQLLLTRAEGRRAALVVLATGLGKTWLAAFDAQSFERVLFVAHREEILRQALETFRRIRPRAKLGVLRAERADVDADVLFASVQSLAKTDRLSRLAPDTFDYVIVDEFHHAAASTYRRVMEYFEPEFLLGLTATPDRLDGASILALCGENEVYRCGLLDGIERGRLVPFDYFGIPDEVDYQRIGWRGRDAAELSEHLETRSRASRALAQLERRGGRRVLGFCCSRSHADFMAKQARAAGWRAAAVHTGPTGAPRASSIEALRAGKLDIIFSVDVLNEGVDIPEVDTVLMLRPTESRIVWLQQLGRGLRLSEE